MWKRIVVETHNVSCRHDLYNYDPLLYKTPIPKQQNNSALGYPTIKAPKRHPNMHMRYIQIFRSRYNKQLQFPSLSSLPSLEK